MPIKLDTNKLKSYDVPEGRPSERSLDNQVNITFLAIGVCFVVAGALVLFSALFFFTIPYYIYPRRDVLIMMLAAMALFYLGYAQRKVLYKEHEALVYFYLDVPQGLVEMVAASDNQDGQYWFKVSIVGYNRSNQIRRLTFDVKTYALSAAYEGAVGHYVDVAEMNAHYSG